MRKIALLFALFFLFILFSFGQDGEPTEADVEQFYKTKTLIVLEENPMVTFNFVIKKVIQENWTLTDYEFIPHSEFEEKRMDPQYSFLTMLVDHFEKDKTKARYKFLHLLMGGDYFRINQMPDLGSIPIAYEGVGEEDYIYKLSALVRLMQEHMKTITEEPSLAGKNMFKYHRDNMEDIKDKTLYLRKDELSKEINSERKIRKVYPYDFKLVSKQEIEDAIDQKDDNVVFLHKVGPEGTQLVARCYKLIVGAAENPNLYYFDYHMIGDKKPDGLLEKDLENLAKGKNFMVF
ncbi:MAG: hypothetical protein ACOCUL_01640 [Bacteroidota bacterium]